jgi:hypothetical protein
VQDPNRTNHNTFVTDSAQFVQGSVNGTDKAS